MKEDYVTFEQAKVLKELGFPFIKAENIKFTKFPTGYLCINPIDSETEYLIPTLTLIQKWLRKEKNIYIQISMGFYGEYYAVFYDTKHPIGTIWNDTNSFDSPEKALSAGIDECIEILKQKKYDVQ